MTISEIMTEIINISQRHHAKEVILFGSRAKNTATAKSDIDIAVSGVSDFEQYKEDVENIPTLYSIDVINMETCGNNLLMEDIRQYGRKIYPAL